MKTSMLCCAVSILILAASCKSPDTILLIGLDESNKEVEVKVDQTIYQKALTNYIQDMNTATINSLEANTDTSWSVVKVEIGISTAATAQAGSVWKVGFNPGQRIVYTKK